MKRGKRYVEAAKLVDRASLYEAADAISIVKKAAKIKSGSATPNKTKVATLTRAEVQKIAELKMPDLNAASIEAATSMIAGTARSMGITVTD